MTRQGIMNNPTELLNNLTLYLIHFIVTDYY